MSQTRDDGTSAIRTVGLIVLTLIGFAGLFYGGVQVMSHRSYGWNLFWMLGGFVAILPGIWRFVHWVDKPRGGYY